MLLMNPEMINNFLSSDPWANKSICFGSPDATFPSNREVVTVGCESYLSINGVNSPPVLLKQEPMGCSLHLLGKVYFSLAVIGSV